MCHLQQAITIWSLFFSFAVAAQLFSYSMPSQLCAADGCSSQLGNSLTKLSWIATCVFQRLATTDSPWSFAWPWLPHTGFLPMCNNGCTPGPFAFQTLQTRQYSNKPSPLEERMPPRTKPYMVSFQFGFEHLRPSCAFFLKWRRKAGCLNMIVDAGCSIK